MARSDAEGKWSPFGHHKHIRLGFFRTSCLIFVLIQKLSFSNKEVIINKLCSFQHICKNFHVGNCLFYWKCRNEGTHSLIPLACKSCQHGELSWLLHCSHCKFSSGVSRTVFWTKDMLSYPSSRKNLLAMECDQWNILVPCCSLISLIHIVVTCF